MNKKILIYNFYNEFNNITYFNQLAKRFQKNYEEVCVFTDYKYRTSFPDADSIITTSAYTNYSSVDNVGKFKQIIFKEKKKLFIDIQNKFSGFNFVFDDIFWQSDIVPGYLSLFTILIQCFQEEKFNFCLPKKDNYDYFNKLKPYVVVNGRNINKGNGTNIYNNNLENLIQFLIENKIKVINTTLFNPNLDYNPDLYSELNHLEDYDLMIAAMANANIVFHVGDSAGIAQNFCTKSNICILNDYVFVTNNSYFKIKEKETVFSARQKIKDVITEKLTFTNDNKDKLLFLCESTPPLFEEFFNKTIIEIL